jgi:hypothetical protein
MKPELFLTYMLLLDNQHNEFSPKTVKELMFLRRDEFPGVRVGFQMMVLSVMRKYKEQGKHPKNIDLILELPESFGTFLMKHRA